MIGIFDSGIGGVTVLKEIIKILPNENYLYYSDSKNNPYGNKTEEELYQITSNIVEFLISKKCKIIVIACNTASAICVNKLRKEYPNITFIATEPAYKMVHDYNPKGNTIIMATERTIESERFLMLYHKYDNHKTTLLPCPGLADLIENNKKIEIKNYLQEKFKDLKNIDNVVLGCTHYPLIKKEIKEILGNVKFYDGSKGVAKELKRKIIKPENQSGTIKFIDSNNSKIKEKRFFNILQSK